MMTKTEAKASPPNKHARNKASPLNKHHAYTQAKASPLNNPPLYLTAFSWLLMSEIGRASCRERVCQYV